MRDGGVNGFCCIAHSHIEQSANVPVASWPTRAGGDARKGAEGSRQDASGSSPAPPAAAEREFIKRSRDVRCDGGEKKAIGKQHKKSELNWV